MMKKTAISLIVAAIVGISPSFAAADHTGMDAKHGTMNGGMSYESAKGGMHGMMMEEMKDSMTGMLLIRKDIDGYQVTFHVMKAPEGMQKHGGNHHFMFKAEKDGKALINMLVNSSVKYPDGKAESKMMMKMGSWYMAGYDLDHQGQYQLMVLFKTADGVKHFGGVFYTKKKEQ